MSTLTETTPNPAAAVTAPLDMMMSSASDGLQAYSEACAGWQQDVVRFVERRVGENQRSLEALMAARDVTDVLKIQQDWALKAATDYTEEATRLARLFTTLSLTGTTPEVQKVATLVC